MTFSLKSSFSRYVIVLFVAVLALTIAGRIVIVTSAWVFCNGWPVCVPTAPLGWVKLIHMSLVGIASILMLAVFRKAWREQREQRIILPLTTILAVMFFGQALVGAIQVTQVRVEHLVILHQLTTIALWISLVLLVYSAGTLIINETKPISQNGRQRTKDFFALSKPLIVGLLLITTYGGLVIGGRAWPSLSLTFWTLLGGALAAGGSSALNQFIDRELDKNMQRTAKLPIADGRLTDPEGLAFGLALCLTSYYIMAGVVKILCALLLLVGVFFFLYFFLFIF